MRFRAFFAFPRPRHGPLVFRFRFNLLLFAFCKTWQKPPVFAPFFECGREPCGCFWVPKPHFWLFPSQPVGPNGFRELSGGVRVSKLIESRTFSRVFLRFCVIQTALSHDCAFLLFSNMLRKPCVFSYFWSRGGTLRFRVCFSVVLGCSLLKNGIPAASETNFGHFPSHAWPRTI